MQLSVSSGCKHNGQGFTTREIYRVAAAVYVIQKTATQYTCKSLQEISIFPRLYLLYSADLSAL